MMQGTWKRLFSPMNASFLCLDHYLHRLARLLIPSFEPDYPIDTYSLNSNFRTVTYSIEQV